jgi:hypothetical protein
LINTIKGDGVMKRLLFLLTVSAAVVVPSAYGMNVLRPWDTLIRPDLDSSHSTQVALFGEYGFKARAYNDDGQSVNPLAIWDCSEKTLSMIKGFSPTSPIGQLATRLSGVIDDGTRGHVELRGDMTEASCAATVRNYFAKNWSVLVCLPFYEMELKDLSICDKTLSITEGDEDVKELLTNNLKANVCTLGKGLSLAPWKRSGFGDVALFVEWMNDFEQAKVFLKNVRVDWRLGGTIPSGKRVDPDKLMALPLGYDGAASIIAGFGIDLTYGRYFKLGGDVELQHVFGNDRCRRIMTDTTQTNLLFLEKVNAYKDFGMNQRFNLYFQFFEVLGGLSLKAGYQYFKHGDDYLSLNSLAYSDVTANTSKNLYDYTLHQAVFVASYNIAKHINEDAACLPAVSLFSRLPFNGTRVIACPTLGATLSLDF